MRKSIIKTLLLFTIVFFGFLVSCGDDPAGSTTYKIEFELNGGTATGTLPTEYDGTKTIGLPADAVTKADSTFGGWYATADLSGEEVKYIKKGETGDKKFYAKWNEGGSGETGGEYKPRWELNPKGYNLGGITVYVQVNPIASYDATDSGYTGERKNDHITHMNLLNKAYNCKVQYHNWEAEWGPARIQYVKDNFLNGAFFKNSDALTYIVTLDSNWIPTLVKANCLASLYNTSSEEGIFSDFDYEQDPTINQVMSVKSNVYGFANGMARPDDFLAYNVTLVEECGLEDPSNLWFQGKWTWSKFLEWARQGQAKLGDSGYALDMSYYPAMVGFVAAQGQYLVNPTTHKIAFTNSNVTNIVDSMLGLVVANLWDPKHAVQDAAANFREGKNLMHNGTTSFFTMADRFGDARANGLKLGVVPYPAKDGENFTVITEPYSYKDTQGNEVKVTEPLKDRHDKEIIDEASGKPIYGLDLSEVDFRVAYTATQCYSVLDYSQSKLYGIDQTVAFSILYDMISGFGDDPTLKKQTNDEGYRTTLVKILDYPADADVLMSLQHDDLTYFELCSILQMTVGDGSNFGADCFYPVLSTLASQKATSCVAKFQEIKPSYEAALKVCGY